MWLFYSKENLCEYSQPPKGIWETCIMSNVLKNILIFAKVAGCGLQNEASLTGIS